MIRSFVCGHRLHGGHKEQQVINRNTAKWLYARHAFIWVDHRAGPDMLADNRSDRIPSVDNLDEASEMALGEPGNPFSEVKN